MRYLPIIATLACLGCQSLPTSATQDPTGTPDRQAVPAAEPAAKPFVGSFGAALSFGGAEVEDAPGRAGGRAFGSRFDLVFNAGDYVDLGLLFAVYGAQMELDDVPNVDLNGVQASLGPLARLWLTAPESEVRPYVEGWIGGHRTRFDVDTPVGTLTDTQGGRAMGAGAGLSFAVAEGGAFEIGVDYIRADFDGDAYSQATMGRLGGRWSF
jgi:hypothetical protein